jgi:ketosteroid isomerase-like protein
VGDHPARRLTILLCQSSGDNAVDITHPSNRESHEGSGMTAVTNLELARRYITALSSGVGAEDFSSFFAPDVVQEEFPNRLLPNGAVRDLQAMKQARVRGQSLLRSEEFKVLSAVASEDQVAMELSWRGTIAVDRGPFRSGQELRARFAVFLEFRDGRIIRQRNYDCFDPW